VRGSCLLLLCLTLPVVAGPPLPLQSAFRTTTFAADGDDGEWEAAVTKLTEAPVAVGVMNDGEFLYLRMRALERGAQMQLLFGGLTVWFDPKGGDRKAFGIKYPVGSPLPDPRSRGQRPGSGTGPSGDDPVHGRGQPSDAQEGRPGPPIPLDLADVVPRRLEVLGPGKDEARSLVLDHAQGLAVGLGRLEGVLVYELRVPLRKGPETPYAIGAEPGATIGVGFDSPKMERSRAPEGGPSGGQGGGGGGFGGFGMGGPGGMGRGGPGGGQPGQMPESAKPWKAWTKVTLARPETAPSEQ
jgi:hypothetical protein